MQEDDRPPTVSAVEVPKLLFVKECADMLRMSYKGMWSVIASGDGPPSIKIRKAVRVPQDTFVKWLEARTR